MPPARRSKYHNKAFSRKQPPLALAQAIFQAVGFDNITTGYVLKEEALSVWEKLQPMEEVALKIFPRYVTAGFLDSEYSHYYDVFAQSCEVRWQGCCRRRIIILSQKKNRGPASDLLPLSTFVVIAWHSTD